MATDVERRIQTLEDELKILKNQIQNTLLDIQEQITLYSSSDLAADRKTARESAAVIQPTSQTKIRSELPSLVQSGAHGRIRPQASRVSDSVVSLPAKSAASGIKRVSLQDLEPESHEPEKADSRPQAAISTGFDVSSFTRLVKWESAGVAQAGVSGVRRALDATVNEGHLPGDIYANLVELLPPEDESEEPELSAFLDIYVQLNAILDREPNLKEALALVEAQRRG